MPVGCCTLRELAQSCMLWLMIRRLFKLGSALNAIWTEMETLLPLLALKNTPTDEHGGSTVKDFAQ